MATLNAGRLKDALTALGKKDAASPALGAIGKVLGSLSQAMEEGQALKLSKAALSGDDLFSRGQLAEAAQQYQRAVKADPRDLRSRYLRACLLFEAGDFAHAASEFQDIVHADPKVTSAAYLGGLATRRLKTPGEPLLDAALDEYWHLPARPELSMAGWDDPVMNILLSQRVSHGGVNYIAPARFDALLAQHPDDPEIAAGVAMLGDREQRLLRLAQAREKFPQSPLILLLLLNEKSNSTPENHLPEILDLLQQWETLAPPDALPKYLLAWYRHYSKPGSKDVLPLAADDVQLVVQANQISPLNSFAATARETRQRVLTQLGHPFLLSARGYDLDFGMIFLDLNRRLRAGAQAEFEAGHAEAGEQICTALQTLGRRLMEPDASVMRHMCGRAVLGTGTEVLRKYYEAQGETGKAEPLKKESEQLQVESKQRLPVQIFAVAMLPVPSLQNALVQKFNEGEDSFLHEQARAAEAAAGQPPAK
jgi:tetratricopeptide (TPR) repeat protein